MPDAVRTSSAAAAAYWNWFGTGTDDQAFFLDKQDGISRPRAGFQVDP